MTEFRGTATRASFDLFNGKLDSYVTRAGAWLELIPFYTVKTTCH